MEDVYLTVVINLDLQIEANFAKKIFKRFMLNCMLF